MKRSEQKLLVRRSLIVSIVVGLAIAVVGCAIGAAGTPPALVGASDGVAGAKAHIEAADKNVVHAKPHADRTGKVLLDAATDNHVDAQAELTKTQKQLVQLGGELQVSQVERQELAFRLKTYDSAWLGGRGRWWLALAKWGIAIAAVLGIGLVVVGLKYRTATWAAYAGRALLTVVPIVGPIVNWVADHLWLNQYKARLAR